MDSKLRQYQTVDTLGKSKVELVVKVYDGAITNLRVAIDKFGKDEFQPAYDALEKAKKFIVHLYTTLDEEKGGEIAEKLGELYAFVIEQINYSQSTRDIEKLNDSIEILNNIREAWSELAEKAKADKSVYEKNPHENRPSDNIKISV